jgi:hypothetical protein
VAFPSSASSIAERVARIKWGKKAAFVYFSYREGYFLLVFAQGIVLFYMDLCAELTKYVPTPWCFVPAESAQMRLPDAGPLKAY